MTIDWRQSSWLELSDALNDFQRARHEAALRVLDAFRQSGTPFLLYLRTFKILQVYDGILMEAHLRRALAPLGANVIRVQQVGGEAGDVVHIGGNFELQGQYSLSRGEVDALFADETPGLVMRHETWRDAVKELIASAELIVSELQFLTPGVVDELRACIDAGKVDQTVLILPVGPFQSAGHEDAIAEFPRAIHQADMNWDRPGDTFVFSDLVARIGRIATLNDAERTRLMPEDEHRALLPVSYDGVAEGMFELAKKYVDRKNISAIIFYGNRSALARKAKKDYVGAIETRLAVAQLLKQAGDLKLALVGVDMAEASVSAERERLGNNTSASLIGRTRESRSKLLAEIFEGLMSVEKAEELGQFANSQAALAFARDDKRAFAQCHAWMSVAACLMENYELALELASLAISLARACNDVFLEAFASVYLGMAYGGLDQGRKAEEAFLNAVKLLPRDGYGRIHAVAMLNLALTQEQLHPPSAELVAVFQSAKTMAKEMGYSDILEAADAGIERLKS